MTPSFDPRRVLLSTLAFALLAAAPRCDAAAGPTYRCEAGGRVQYQGTPCTVGAQSTIAAEPAATAADRAAAAERARTDRMTLAQIERDRARERAEDRRARALAVRAHSDRDKQVQACATLARRARDARDGFGIAGPRDQPKARLKMAHAEADFAALCRR